MEAHRQRQFRIHQCLGRGGFGEVYRATMFTPGGLSTDVALKVLRVDVDPGAEAVRRLRDEGRMLSAVRHPAILRAHDLALLEGRVALVTEYVSGQDLSELVSQDGALPPRALVQAIGVIADALDTAWSHVTDDGRPMRLVHRDIKPSNIRIGRHGEVKLLDFGIARSDEVDRESRTGTGSTVGSLAYMAPERFSRTPAARPADMYALGCSLFEGLAAHRLHQEAVPVEMFRLASDPALHGAFVEQSLAELGADIDPGLVDLLRGMLTHAPAERPMAPEVARRCEDLGERLTGPSLRTWARARQWPTPGLVPGHFDGRTITEGTLQTSSFDEVFRTDERTADATFQMDLAALDDTQSLAAGTPALPPDRRGGWVLGLGALAALLALGMTALWLSLQPPETVAVGRPVPTETPTPVALPQHDDGPVASALSEGPPTVIEPAVEPAPVPVPAPAPVVVTPAPVRPQPRPVVVPKPTPVSTNSAAEDDTDVEGEGEAEAPEPAPVVKPKGTVVVKGSADRVLLVSDDESLSPGEVPAGLYTVYAAFMPEGQAVKVNVIEVRPGQRVTVTCNKLTYTCE